MSSGISRRQWAMASFASGSLLALNAQTMSGAAYNADDERQDVAAEVLGPVEAVFERDYEPPSFKPAWKKSQINRTLAADFVIFAHSDLEMTRKLLAREPGVLNASIDWGAGDFETALGGASHMGRHDIVGFLLEQGARPDLFCMAMLGELAAVKAMLETQPVLIDAKGPHGFSLHFHAQVGGAQSATVLDYLQSIKEMELQPIPFLKSPK